MEGMDMLNQRNPFSLMAVLPVNSLFLSHISAAQPPQSIIHSLRKLAGKRKKDRLMKVSFSFRSSRNENVNTNK